MIAGVFSHGGIFSAKLTAGFGNIAAFLYKNCTGRKARLVDMGVLIPLATQYMSVIARLCSQDMIWLCQCRYMLVIADNYKPLAGVLPAVSYLYSWKIVAR